MGHPSVTQQVLAQPFDEIAITIVSVEEQIRGRLSAIRRASQPSSSDKLVRMYRKFHEALDDLMRFTILDFIESADLTYRDLRQKNPRLGTQDLRIASIAYSLRATVVTRNQQDFRQIPNLSLADWTIPL